MFDRLVPEETSASRNERQQLDRLLRIAAPHERVILAGIGVLLLAFAAWATFGSVSRSVTADGLLIKPGMRYEVVSAESGHLVEFLVAPGDFVEAGALIARQSVPVLEREAAVLRDRIAVLEAGIGQTGGTDGILRMRLESAQAALLQMEVRQAARALITSPAEGEVMTLRAVLGDHMPAGGAIAQIREVRGPRLQAVMRVAPHVAQRIRPGMPASVEVMMPDGTAHHLDGEVATVTGGPLPHWLAMLPPAVTDSAHRIDVTFRHAQDMPATDGAACRIRVTLGRHSLLALVAPGHF